MVTSKQYASTLGVCSQMPGNRPRPHAGSILCGVLHDRRTIPLQAENHWCVVSNSLN